MDFIVMNRMEIPQMILTSGGFNGATVLSAKYKEELDGMPTLTLQVVENLDTAMFVKSESIIAFFDELGVEAYLGGFRFFVIKEIIYHDDPAGRIMEVYCEDYALELLDHVCRVDLLNNTASVRSKMAAVLDGTRWTVDTSNLPDDPTHIPFPQATKNKTVLEVLQMIASEFGLHLKFTIGYFDGAIQSREVTMKANLGEDRGIVLDYNFNLESVERTVDSTNVKTAIVPIGGVPDDSPEGTPPVDITGVSWSAPNNPENKPLGQDWLEDTNATTFWGFNNPNNVRIPRYVFYQNDKIKDAGDLIIDAWNQLKKINAPIVNYKMKVIDLFALSGYNYHDNSDQYMRLGDTVTVIDRGFLQAYDVTATVISRELDLLDVATTVIELGNLKKSVVSTTSNFSNFASSSGTGGLLLYEVSMMKNDISAISGEVVVANTAIIGTARIGDLAVTTAKIADANITTAKIGDAQITNAKIDRASTDKLVVGTADIQDASITNAKIDRASANKLVVGTADIQDASITNAKIGSLAVGTANMQDLAIQTAKIGNAQITQAKIANLAVGTAQIIDASITSAKIGSAQIQTAHIADAQITSAKIGAGQIQTANIGDAQIATAKIANGAITTALIGTGAVDTAQVKDGSITDAKIVGLTASKITAGTIDAGVITVNNLNANNITTGTINGQYIAGGAIDSTKLATALNTTINTASSNASTALTNASTAQTTADGKNTVFYTSTAPSTTGRKVGDTWFDTDDGNKMYQWNGTAWTATQFGTNAIANLAITNALIADATIQSGKIASLDAGKITTGTLLASVIGAGSISTAKIASSAITTDLLAASAVTGAKISAGTITADKLVADAITAREIASATITANEIASNTITAGQIASSTITAGQIASGTITATQIASNTITTSQLASNVGANLDISSNASISLKADKTYVDNMKISGRNLVSNSTGAMGTTGWANSITAEIVDGKYALRIDNNTTTEKLVYTTPRIAVKPNTKYQISLLIKGDANSTTADIYFLSRNAGSANDYDYIHGKAASVTSTSFTKYSLSFTTTVTET